MSAWLAATGSARGYVLDLGTLWRLAAHWYDGRLDRGHGMASMKSRAKQMHGQCLVESGPGWGTVIRLTIPL